MDKIKGHGICSLKVLLELTWLLLIEGLHSALFVCLFVCLISVKVDLHLVNCKVLPYFQISRSL